MRNFKKNLSAECSSPVINQISGKLSAKKRGSCEDLNKKKSFGIGKNNFNGRNIGLARIGVYDLG